MKKSNFDLLMERYVAGRVTVQERRKIEAWIDAMTDRNIHVAELSEEEEERIFQKLTVSLVDTAKTAVLKPERSTFTIRWVARIAASLLIISAVAAVAWRYAVSQQNRPEMLAKNRVERIELDDGSLVWLRGKGKVRYEEVGGGSRFAAFEGEALFEVVKDESRPFVIQCGDVKVKVLGTSFSLRTSPDRLELTVLTGKVNLSSSTYPEGIDVLPWERAVYKSNDKFEKLPIGRSEISTIVADTQYNMEFTNARIDDVITRLEDKFGISIRLSDEGIRNCRVTMDLTDQSLDTSLQLITEVLDVSYFVEDKEVTITGTPCE